MDTIKHDGTKVKDWLTVAPDGTVRTRNYSRGAAIARIAGAEMDADPEVQAAEEALRALKGRKYRAAEARLNGEAPKDRERGPHLPDRDGLGLCLNCGLPDAEARHLER